MVFSKIGIKTILRNWEGSNIVEIPIPVIYPNVLLDKEDFERAKDFISAFMQSPETNGENWHCEKCGEAVELQLNEAGTVEKSKLWLACLPPKKAVKGTGEERMKFLQINKTFEFPLTEYTDIPTDSTCSRLFEVD